METKAYNLIIVDKSGSMSNVTNETIAGVNETIGGIKATATKNPDQKQFITLVAFCGCGQNYIFDNVTAEETRFITEEDYTPCCNTPLYDAIGFSCLNLEKQVGDDKMAVVSVTILTDGYENSSREFNHSQITNTISRLKNKGWMFAYIGADHDVESVAFSLQIENTMMFQKNTSAMKTMFEENNLARERYAEDMHTFACSVCECSEETDMEELFLEKQKSRAKNYFDHTKVNKDNDEIEELSFTDVH